MTNERSRRAEEALRKMRPGAAAAATNRPRRNKVTPKRLEYHLTGDKYTKELEKSGVGGAKDWRCVECQQYYNDDRKSGKWIECDKCLLAMHVTCIPKEHTKEVKLGQKLKENPGGNVQFKCHYCCRKKCCKK
jgi:hypothetical protein